MKKILFVLIVASLLLAACGGAEAPVAEAPAEAAAPPSEPTPFPTELVEVDVPGFEPVYVEAPVLRDLTLMKGEIIVVPGQKVAALGSQVYNAYKLGQLSTVVATIFAGIMTTMSREEALSQVGVQPASDRMLFVDIGNGGRELWTINMSGSYTIDPAYPLHLDANIPLSKVKAGEYAEGTVVHYSGWSHRCRDGWNYFGDEVMNVQIPGFFNPDGCPKSSAEFKKALEKQRAEQPELQKFDPGSLHAEGAYNLDMWIAYLGG